MSEAEPNALKNSLAGTVAGVAQVFSGQPFDTGKIFFFFFHFLSFISSTINPILQFVLSVKVRLQSQGHGKDKLYNGVVDCVQKIVKNEGLGAFYKVCVFHFFHFLLQIKKVSLWFK